MRSTGMISILNIGQDNLFAGLPDCAVDHVPTGATITPSGAQRRSMVRHLPRILTNLSAGKYDLVVLPAIDFRWPHDNSRLKRALRYLAWAVLRFRPISACVNRL